jgi:CelD/BcsL family acetyltransferase involved in cellulose biosynthesis
MKNPQDHQLQETRIEAALTLDDIVRLEPAWKEFEQQAVSTPYQGYDWCRAWYEHVSPALGETPCPVLVRAKDGTPLLLLPLAIKNVASLRIARFIGLSHSNFNMPVIAPQALDLYDGETLAALLTRIGRHLHLDAFWLHNQPYEWLHHKNPMAQLAHIASPSFAYSATLPASGKEFFEQHYESSSQRKRLRNKQNHFARLGNFAFIKAGTEKERLAILDAFYGHKKEWFHNRGIRNTFEPPFIRRFFEQVSLDTLELYAFRDDKRVAAAFGTMVKDGRMTSLFTSISNDEQLMRGSPGEILLLNLMMDCCDRGLASFDLGVGEAAYKNHFCPIEEPLFDTAFPLSFKGRIASRLWLGLHHFKRYAKKRPRLLHILQRLRSLFG